VKQELSGAPERATEDAADDERWPEVSRAAANVRTVIDEYVRNVENTTAPSPTSP
jgi:hypothetical protein